MTGTITSRGDNGYDDGGRGREDGARRLMQKLLVTVLAGGVVYVLSTVLAPTADDVWQLVLSVLCGGAVLIVQFMVTFAHQLGDLKSSVEKRFIDIGRATKLFNEVEKLRDDGVPRLAESATHVVSIGPQILHDFAREEINRLALQMDDLTNLSAECPGENHDWLLSLTKCAKRSVYATSTSVDRDFWSTEPAGRYLEAQRKAIEDRGVTVRRLFVVRQTTDIPGLADLCKEQRDVGIEVRVVALSQLPLYVQRGKMIDFIVFDEELSYEIGVDQLSVNSWTTVNARADDVQQRIRRFGELWNASPGGSPNGVPDSTRTRTGGPDPTAT
ncbi:hypothetical protein OIB37_13055 [Streptomyces sp. NBC_00820]|uniref:hypothetical protein n=1 Tax=Streptomyces sp. NBC_00820 TaxID=2975842 RepID=UPI002ED25B79|nr:hypothetical protein OIB37_13055 [Streptomyces sp. NBC_00820]